MFLIARGVVAVIDRLLFCSSDSCGLGGLDGQSIAMANVLEIKSDHVALGH